MLRYPVSRNTMEVGKLLFTPECHLRTCPKSEPVRSFAPILAAGHPFCLAQGSISESVLHPPLQRAGNKKPRYRIDSGVSFTDLVPER